MAGGIITDQSYRQRRVSTLSDEVFDALRHVQQQLAGNSLSVN